MNNLARILLSLSLISAAAAFAADTQPNFSGTWKLNVAKSEMGTSGVTELVVDVDHQDPVFKYTAKGMAGGQEFEETETINTDGNPRQDSQGATVKAHWEGADLVAEATGADGNKLYVARLTLSPGCSSNGTIASRGMRFTKSNRRLVRGEARYRHEGQGHDQHEGKWHRTGGLVPAAVS